MCVGPGGTRLFMSGQRSGHLHPGVAAQWMREGALQDALRAVVRAMAHYRATRAVGEEEAPLLQAACAAMTETLCPFIVSCFTRIFPEGGPSDLDLAVISSPLLETEESDCLPQLPAAAGA